MLTKTFDYHLPPELIAQRPPDKRDESRLMVLSRDTGKRAHCMFRDLPELLSPGDLLVINDTRVIPARLYVKKSTGARIEVTLIEKFGGGDSVWRCLAKPGRRLRAGEEFEADAGIKIRPIEKFDDGSWKIEIITDDVFSALDKAGRAPLPPYIRRSADESREADIERYQTVYAREPGAVAAPTAGLHFTPELLGKLHDKGVKSTRVTLHVGWGSFAPVREKTAEEHRVAPEYIFVGEDAAKAIDATRNAGGRVIAVGTTSVRAVETAWREGTLMPMTGATDLYIIPGYNFNVVDALITNFHLPKSSLIMLAAAFAGTESILDAYREAVEMKYRFYSYGDAMLIL